MQPDLIGIDSVCEAIQNAPYFQWRIHARNPVIGKDGSVDESAVKYAAIEVENNQTAAEHFRNWAELVTRHNPNNTNVYWLEMCRLASGGKGAPPKYTPLIQTFVLGSMYMNNGQKTPIISNEFTPGQAPGPAPAPAPVVISGPTPGTYTDAQVKMMLENERLQIENERLRLERELLEEEDDEEDEEEENDLLGSIGVKDPELKNQLYMSLGKIAGHFAEKLTGGAGMAGVDTGILADLQAIKNASPNAVKVIEKLGKLAKTNPAAVDEFVNSILPHLDPPQE